MRISDWSSDVCSSDLLFHLVRVGRIALARLDVHDRQGETPRRNELAAAMLARASGAGEAVLRALVAFDLGAFESRPVRLAVSKARDVAVHNLLEHGILKLGGPAMPRDSRSEEHTYELKSLMLLTY